MANWSPLLSEMTERRCGACRTSKPLDQFYAKKRAAKYPGRLSSISSTCKECCRALNARRPARGMWLMKLYGLSVEDWNRMFLAQGGKCAICDRHQTAVPKQRLQVDHDHETDKIRGLLCSDCNMGLGLFRDNLTSLAKASEYLQQAAGKAG